MTMRIVVIEADGTVAPESIRELLQVVQGLTQARSQGAQTPDKVIASEPVPARQVELPAKTQPSQDKKWVRKPVYVVSDRPDVPSKSPGRKSANAGACIAIDEYPGRKFTVGEAAEIFGVEMISIKQAISPSGQKRGVRVGKDHYHVHRAKDNGDMNEARPRTRGVSSPLNPNVIGSGSRMDRQAERPIPKDLQDDDTE